MAELSERHEVRLRGKNQTIVFIADSDDGRLVIRQEPDGKKIEDVCSITLADPDELRAFFKGLRRIIASLGYGDQVDQQRAQHSETSQPRERTLPPAASDDREAVVAHARQKNPQAFAAWTKEEERQVSQRYNAGESFQSIARAHKRSPRAIELRLQKLGLLPPDES